MENQDAQRLYASSAETRGGIERLIFDGTIRTVVDIKTKELRDLIAGQIYGMSCQVCFHPLCHSFLAC